MRNVELRFSNGLTPERSFELTIRDQATGHRLFDVQIKVDDIGELIGGASMPGLLVEHDQPTGPTRRETMVQFVEAPILPEDKASRDAVVAQLVRPYEEFGWRATRAHVGDRNRIERVLPGGKVLYRVEFERFVHETRVP